MRIVPVVVSLLLALAVVAQDAPESRPIDLAVTDPALPRFFSVNADKPFSIKLLNVVPGETYQIVEEDRSLKAGDKAKAVTTPDCAEPKQLIGFLEGKDKEADVAKELKDHTFPSTCTAPQIQAAKDLTTLTFPPNTLGAGKTMRRTIKRGTVEWKVVVFTQGASVPPTAAASDSPNLDRLREITDKHPSLIVMKCSYSAEKCASDAIFVNSDAVSSVYVTDIPKGKKLTVRVGAGEYFPDELARYNLQTYLSSPDTIVVPIQMWRSRAGILGSRMGSQEAEAKRRYGLADSRGATTSGTEATQEEAITAKAMTASIADLAGDQELSEKVHLRITDILKSFRTTATDPRWLKARIREMAWEANPSDPPPDPDPQVPLFVRGRSEVALIQLDFGGGDVKTIIVPIRYQRFWLDAGGFFVFTRHTDQSIQTSTISGSTPEKKKVDAINREVSIDPATGIVINVHPGNYPVLAVQFGIAANQGRLPSYFLGIGARAREIGKRGLATIAVGAAMQQENQFPFVKPGDEIESSSARLQPKAKYGVTFPYISISLGFSFGGVSEKTDVKAAVASVRSN